MENNLTQASKTKKQIRKEKLVALLASADKEVFSQSDKKEAPSIDDHTESFKDLYKESTKNAQFNVGDVVKGRIIAIEDDYILVDVCYKSEGIIPKSEFRISDGESQMKVGQELDVYIDRIEDDNGMMVLSKDRADIIRVWKYISQVAEKEEIIDGTIIAKVKGGLSVDIGVKAFLPGSQIELRSVHNLSNYIGKKMQFKVIKFNQKRGNIVLSRRVLLTQERKNQRTRVLSEIKEGAIVKGVVKNITDYGAFLDLGGIDGLLHITDMCWGRIKHPSELIKLGEEKDVKILKFDQEKNRVSLGLKQMEEDPWTKISQEVKIGDTVTASVVSLTDYGAFMKIKDGVEGLVHVSEMTWGKKLKHPSEILKVGEDIKVKVLAMDQAGHRISLGIRQLQKNPWVDLKEKYPVGTELSVTVKSVTDFCLFVGAPDIIMDGFIHVSDLSWTKKHIDPKKEYKEGDKLQAFVKNINVEEEKFNLSLKSLSGDPWLNAKSQYPPGSRHEVQVVKIMDFGVFVELEPGVEGLIHISELSTQRVNKPESVTKLGDKLKAEVLSIDLDARKIGLSVKQVALHEKAATSGATLSSKKAPSNKKAFNKTESFFGRALKASLAWSKTKPNQDGGESTESTKSTEQQLYTAPQKTQNNDTEDSNKDSIKDRDTKDSTKNPSTKDSTNEGAKA